VITADRNETGLLVGWCNNRCNNCVDCVQAYMSYWTYLNTIGEFTFCPSNTMQCIGQNVKLC